MTELAFFIKIKELKKKKNLKDPLCQRKEGKAPAQFIDIDEVNEKAAKAAAISAAIDINDIDDGEFYGDEGFNEDELGELSDYDDDDMR